MSELRLDDPVLYAFQCFENEGFSYGAIIPEQWFKDKFGIKKPETIAEADEFKMTYARYLGALRAMLLNDKKMALRTKSGVGQEIVMPSDQTGWAMQEAKNNILKELEKANDRLLNIDHSRLSQQEIQENTNAIAGLGFFKRTPMKELW